MSRWETTSGLSADVSPGAIWEHAYADADAWPKWNAELKRASLDGPPALGAQARIVFRTGLRLRFRFVEFEEGRLFTDEARLPGARMGHRHLLEPGPDGGCRLTNTIYIEGPLASLWRRILGPAATRSLPGAQEAVVELTRACLAGPGRNQNRAELGALLMEHWDPIGVGDEPEAAGEYDAYVNPLLRHLEDGADADSVAAYLATIESEQMGLPALPGDRLGVAERILDWHRRDG